jgi:hypothetical protein
MSKDMSEAEQIRGNRLVLLTIAGIPLTMILAATWLWYFVIQGDLDLVGALGTSNSGTLVQPPRQLDELEMREDTGALFKYSDFEPKWALVVPGQGASCDESCEQALYVTRQIHIAIGKEFNRIRRLYLSEVPPRDTSLDVATLSDGRPAPDSFSKLLQTDHRGLKTLTLPEGGSSTLFPEQRVDASTWYLVDPGGWIMMSYNSEIHYKDVISDLKFLLKNSSE